MMRPPWLALVALGWGGACAAQGLSVTLQKPQRDFGVFVGDLLTSTAILPVPPGTTLDTRSLPAEGPVSPSIDVRRVAVGGTPARVEIRVTYQSFFSPDQVLRDEVPGYTVAFSASGRQLKAAVPGFGFTASTFRHDLQPMLDPAILRPDHAPVAAQAGDAVWQMSAGLVAMVAGLLALVWPRPFASRQAPFAKAGRELARLARVQTDAASHEAMLVMHRAFDATAGRRLFADDLDDFLHVHRGFVPLRDRIAAFFDKSRAVFFGHSSQVPEAGAWTGLCRDLARAERSG